MMDNQEQDGGYWCVKLWAQRTVFILSTIVLLGGIIYLNFFNKTHEGNVTCPDIRFDSSHIHKDIAVEEEGKVITNSERLVSRRQQLKLFKGIINTFTVKPGVRAIIKMAFVVEMKTMIKEKTSLLQIGLVHKDNIDEKFTLDKTLPSYVIRMSECSNKSVCLVTATNNVDFEKEPVMTNAYGSSVSGIIIIAISPESLLFAFSGTKMFSKILHRINRTQMQSKLTPVYGVGDKHAANVTLAVVYDVKNIAFFDKETCHRDIYISEDGKAISNVMINEGFQTGFKVGKQLFRGARCDMSFKLHQLEYNDKPFFFVVTIKADLSMINKFLVTDSIFEVGLGPDSILTKHSTLHHHGRAWSVRFSRCSTLFSLCALIYERGNFMKTIHFPTIDVFESYVITLDFDIDPNEGNIKIGYNSGTFKRNQVYHFRNVDFSSPLYPIFGMTERTFVKIKLLTKDRIPNYNILGYFGSSPICDV